MAFSSTVVHEAQEYPDTQPVGRVGEKVQEAADHLRGFATVMSTDPTMKPEQVQKRLVGGA